MLQDLDFLAGDAEHLRGKGIIFTENLAGSENPFNPRYPALAVAPDPGELLDLLSTVSPLPDRLRHALLDKIRQASEMWARTMFGQPMHRFVREMLSRMDQIDLPEDIKEQLKSEMSEIPEEDTGAPFHACFIPLVGFDPGAIQPFQEVCDVCRAQAVPSITYAGLVLNGHAQHYLAMYYLQQEDVAVEEGDDAPEPVPTARELTSAEFMDLLNRKVSELMYTRESGGDVERLIKELRRLTAGTVFVRDVLNLARFSETDHPRKIEVIDLYIRRIHLLARERYEEIPAVDRKIKDLVESSAF